MNIAIKDRTDFIKTMRARVGLFFGADFWRNFIVRWLIAGTFGLNIINWLSLIFFLKRVDFPSILHYNVYFGVDVIGDWRQAYLAPAMGLFFAAVNGFLAYHFYQRAQERIAAYILLLSAVLIQLGLLIASSSIILINY